MCFELGLFFLIKYKKQPVQIKNSQDIGFSALFHGISFLRFFLLLGDYYAIGTITAPFLIWSIGSFRYLFLTFGYFSINIGFLMFIFYMEKYKKFFLKKYFFTFCFLIQIFFLISMVLIDIFSIFYLSILLLPLFIIFLILYAKNFNKQAKKQKMRPNDGLKMGFSILLVLSGHVLTLDLVCDYFGFITRLSGISMQLFAIGMIFKLFRNFIPFFEFNWQNKIENIYILNRDGINLYSKSYLEEKISIDKHFISGALSSINTMLNELLNSKENKISIIKKKNKIVTIFTSVYIIGVLISTEELEIFKLNLKRLVLKIEMLYRNILINWSGDRNEFYPVKDIVTDIFSM